MIKRLEINNFILIKNQTINFDQKINILTGETGSGKSMIVQAIKFITGQRAKSSLIFKDQELLTVKITCNINEIMKRELLNLGIESSKEIEVVRTLNQAGVSKIRIEGQLISLSELKLLMEPNISIYSQDDSYELKSNNDYLSIIDEQVDKQLIDEYKQEYSRFQAINKKIEHINKKSIDGEYHLEVINKQLKDLEKFDETIDYEDLINQKNKMEKIRDNYQDFKDITNLNQSLNQKLVKHYDQIENDQMVDNLVTLLDDFDYYINSKVENFEQYKYDQIVDDLSTYKYITRKYGLDSTLVIEKKRQLMADQGELESLTIDLKGLENKLIDCQKQLEVVANKLTNKRLEIAEDIEKRVNLEIVDLKMQEAKFKIVIEKDPYGSSGVDQINFLVSLNKGSDMLALDQSASGGELARFMLALKIATSNTNNNFLILDEIDTGVSGEVAYKIAKKMKEMATSNTLLVITHLSQIAAISNQHLKVYKEEDNNLTNTKIKVLNDQQKVDELASIISSDKITDEARLHAQKLLDN